MTCLNLPGPILLRVVLSGRKKAQKASVEEDEHDQLIELRKLVTDLTKRNKVFNHHHALHLYTPSPPPPVHSTSTPAWAACVLPRGHEATRWRLLMLADGFTVLVCQKLAEQNQNFMAAAAETEASMFVQNLEVQGIVGEIDMYEAQTQDAEAGRLRAEQKQVEEDMSNKESLFLIYNKVRVVYPPADPLPLLLLLHSSSSCSLRRTAYLFTPPRRSHGAS